MSVWCRVLLKEFNEEQPRPSLIHEDNMACISLSKGEGLYLTSKHIGLRHHYLKETLEAGEIMLVHVSTEKQLADLLTKTLAPVKFKGFMRLIVFDQCAGGAS